MAENPDRVELAQLFAKIAFWTEQQAAQPLAGAVQQCELISQTLLGELQNALVSLSEELAA